MEYKEFTAKTVEEAIELGLTELGLTKENAEIVVLEEQKKKLFGWTKARVKIAKKAENESCDCGCCGSHEHKHEHKHERCDCDSHEHKHEENSCSSHEKCEKSCCCDKTDGERTVEFLEGLFDLLRITACTELVSEDERVIINVTAANTNSVIGARGVMLDAIQTLAGAVANTGREEYKRVVVDCENYRETREGTLNKLADNLAQKAIRLGKKIKLEPMNPYERRIIHAALSGREDVTTQSEGKEPNRCIVVIPANLEDPDAPALSVSKDRRSGDRGGRGYNRNDRRGGNRNGGYNRKPMRRDRPSGSSNPTGGTSMKPSNDFFGIFLGNSGNDDKKE